jgi:hypothetical protein
VDYGLVPRVSLFVANPDSHCLSTSGDSGLMLCFLFRLVIMDFRSLYPSLQDVTFFVFF